MKYLIFLIIFLGLYAPVNAEVLKGGVSYTVDEARAKAFSNVPLKIDMNEYKKYFKDPNYEENKKAISDEKKRLKGRQLTFFSVGGYSIVYYNNLTTAFYYDDFGNLELIEFHYQEKDIAYTVSGNLDRISLLVKKSECFIFDLNKKLVAHWIGNNCYNEKGELILTRE